MVTFLARWFGLFMFFTFVINIQVNDNLWAGLGGATLGLIAALIWGAFVRVEAETPHSTSHPASPPPPPYDWAPMIRTIKILAIVAGVIVVSVVSGVWWITGNWYPTQPPETWARIKAEIGIPANSVQPGWREEMASLVRTSAKIPIWPDRESFVGLITDAARKSDIDQVVIKLQESRDASNAYRVNRTLNLIKVEYWVIMLYFAINIINQLVALKISWALPGLLKSKITIGSLIVLVITLAISFFWIQPEAGNAASQAFNWGATMGSLSLFFSLLGVGLTLLSRALDPNHPNGDWIDDYARVSSFLNHSRTQLVLKFGFAIFGATVGSVTDTVFQVFILNDILTNSAGKATMQEIVVMYLLGALFFRFIAAIFGPYTAVAQASTVETN